MILPHSNFQVLTSLQSSKGMLSGKLGLLVVLVVALAIAAYLFVLPNTDKAAMPALSELPQTPDVNTPAVAPSMAPELETVTEAEIVESEEPSSEPVISLPVAQEEFPVVTIDAKDESAQLAQAKAAAEAAERFNQQKLKRLQMALTEDASEVESLAKVEISYLVNRWRDAWAAGSTDDYLSFYSDKFVPAKNQTLDQWKNKRRNRVTPSKVVTINLSNFKVSINEALNASQVEFDQHYVSGNYDDQSRKKLVFTKESLGWKLISETSLDNDS